MILKRANILCSLLLPLFLVACNAPHSTEISDWSRAVQAAHQQSDTTFAAVNTLVRDQEIKYAAGQPSLKPDDFTPGLTSDALAAWDASLDALSTYADNVAKVADPTTYAGTGQSAANLAQAIAARAHSQAFQNQPGLADAVSKIGDAVASAAGAAEAQSILRKANPGIQSLLSQLSDMIASTAADGTETGVIATVKTNWGVRLAAIQISFLAPNANKEAVAASYADTAAQRDSAVAVLRSLQASLRQLARNHGELAAGQATDTAVVLAEIQQYTKLASDILQDLKKQPDKK